MKEAQALDERRKAQRLRRKAERSAKGQAPTPRVVADQLIAQENKPSAEVAEEAEAEAEGAVGDEEKKQEG